MCACWSMAFPSRTRLVQTDVFTNRMAKVPSAPDVAVYGTGALIAWEAAGDLYTVERAPNRTYGAAVLRNRLINLVVA